MFVYKLTQYVYYEKNEKILMNKIRELNKKRAIHVHGEEDSILARCQFSQILFIDSLWFKYKFQQVIFWYWQTNSKVYMEKQKTQNSQHKTELEQSCKTYATQL